MHGVIVDRDNRVIEVTIGEAENDPVFCVTDLLPHLAGDQMKRTLAEGVKGEELNVLIGSLPFKDDEISEKVKLNLLNILFEKYGVIESDFLSAELEVVPAFKAKDLGFDRSMVGAYGHDDRVCAYTSLRAILETEHPKKPLYWYWLIKKKSGAMAIRGLSRLSCVISLPILQNRSGWKAALCFPIPNVCQPM